MPALLAEALGNSDAISHDVFFLPRRVLRFCLTMSSTFGVT